MKRLLVIFLILACPVFRASAQELSLNEYLSWVIREHPLMQTAELKSAVGNAQLLQVKGLFDPVLESKFKQKFSNDQNYYSTSSTGISYPTPYAFSLISQVDMNTGAYLNPVDYTKNAALLSVGVAVPLLKGLVYDERRMAKHRAEKIQEAYEIEKTVAINELLYQSTLLYRNWCYTYERMQVTQTIREAALTRHANVCQRYVQGDRAAIDTVESFTQVTNRTIQFSEAELDYIKARIALVAFMQDSTSNKLGMLSQRVIPDKQELESTSLLLPVSHMQLQEHPEILLYNNKLDVLSIERKWKNEKLKPKLNVEYNALQQPIGGDNFTPNLSNYKWGFEFSTPLFMREARGDLKIQELKIQETHLTKEWKQQQLLQKSVVIQNAYEQLNTQLSNSARNAKLYAQLVEAETKKMEVGESNLFLVNARENTLFESQLKLVDLKNKLALSKADWSYLWYLSYE